MKKIYISPVCEAFLTDEEERLLLSSAEIVSGDPGGYIPPYVDPTIPVDNGDGGGGSDIGSGGFAKGGMIWYNSTFD